MLHADFPADFLDFLESGRKLEYDSGECEPGKVTLLPLKKIVLWKCMWILLTLLLRLMILMQQKMDVRWFPPMILWQNVRSMIPRASSFGFQIRKCLEAGILKTGMS